MPGPLSGIKVLDLSRVLAGPWCTQTLADLGAEVIKVEKPGAGDDTRHWGPPWASDESGQPTSEAAYFLSANRGKKSITLDFTKPEGQAVVRRLAQRADILIENYKVGGLAKHGLDYDGLKPANPRLIYCSITGFGQTGPYRDLAGYDFQIQGLGGLMSITGLPDGAPGGGPVKVGVAVADVFSGLYATIGILAALNRRNATGRGEYVDIALLDCQIAVLANQSMNYLISGVAPTRLGNAHPNIVPYQAFQTKDGHVILAVGNDDQFAKFCHIAGRNELAGDVRFKTNPARVKNRETLVEMIAEIMRERSTSHWLDALGKASIPSGPINTIAEVFSDPQVIARGLRLNLAHAAAGTVPSVASPIRLRESALDPVPGPPTLGQHTDEVLRDLADLSISEIEALRRSGSI
jgi:crotonobetainyl-CoA:carnitine CoA-transferase CaiB-like acyl-CoA transferase